MKRANFAAGLLAAALLLLAAIPPTRGAAIDDLIAGAKKEGVLELYAPSTLTPEGAQRLGEAFNKKYGLNVRLNFTPAGAMTRDVGKIVSIAATGQPAPGLVAHRHSM